jgi:hypothetical protein
MVVGIDHPPNRQMESIEGAVQVPALAMAGTGIDQQNPSRADDRTHIQVQ